MNNHRLKVAFQMDNLQDIAANPNKFNSDSTVALIQEAYSRNFEIYYYHPANLSLVSNKINSIAQPINHIAYNNNQPVILGTAITLDLSTMDVIWLRQDPPFDMAYITSTYMLDYLVQHHNHIQVFNNATAVRDYSEKIVPHYFIEYMPKSIITRSKPLIYDFLHAEQQAVIKPLYDAKGNGVYLLTLEDPNTDALIDYFITNHKEPFIVQKFLPKISLGDKRVLILDGKPVGSFSRVPQRGITSNLAKGGRAVPTNLTPKEQLISEAVGKFLQQHNVIFAGIDLIDEHLTEINITSPTGIMTYYEMTGINLAKNIWEIITQKYL